MSPSAPDSSLLRDARRGDRRAFALLVERHYPMLLNSCRRMLRDDDLAREAAQEAVMRAMLGLDGLRDDERFGAWLVGIGLNVSRSLLASRRRRSTVEAPVDDAGDGDRSPAAPAVDPAAWSDARELATRVREAIGALPAGQRHAVALFYLAGLTHAEIATEIGTAPGAIKTRLHKARRHLRASLLDTYEEEFAVTTHPPELVPMHVAELRRTTSDDPLAAEHIVFLEAADGRRLAIWIGLPEATALAVTLEEVELPRPGVYQFTAGLLAAAGATVREVRVTELTDSTFYAETILSDGSTVDSRPSDAMTLALVTGAPILVATAVIEQADRQWGSMRALLEEADAAPDDAHTIAEEVTRRRAEATKTIRARTTDTTE